MHQQVARVKNGNEYAPKECFQFELTHCLQTNVSQRRIALTRCLPMAWNLLKSLLLFCVDLSSSMLAVLFATQNRLDLGELHDDDGRRSFKDGEGQ